jgi:hypothetical protein
MKSKTIMLWKYLQMFWSIIRVRLGWNYSKEPILSGPYYMFLSEKIRECKYTGTITDDFLLTDQCKICGIKKDYKLNKLPKDVEIL